MKKILIFLLAALLLVGCSTPAVELSDGEKLKEEYEQLNGKEDSNGNKYSTIEINSKSTVRFASEDELEDLFLKGTHVLYLGWPECGWCRRALPVLIDTVNQYSGINLYVFNIKQARSDFSEGKQTDLASLYQQICNVIDLCDLDVDEYFDRYEDGTLKLVSSAIYFIKDGAIIGIHKRTVDSHLDAFEPLTSSQIEELSGIYSSYLDILTTQSEIGCSECDE